jgi:hypothetical protein
MQARTERQVLSYLRRRGARRLRRVTFRSNRSTIWSVTQGGAVLNLHVAYRTAPTEVLNLFGVIVRDVHRGGSAYRAATAAVREWEGLDLELRRIRREHRTRRPSAPRRRRAARVGPCCATEEQRRYLGRLYRYLNRTRFDNRLPPDVPLRLSNRMTTRFGQVIPGFTNGSRYVVELALNVDLMLEGNGKERIDTLVHEMAHVADWLFNGELGHGATWRRWAHYAGCKESACAERPLRRRRRGVTRVTRVPRLPGAAREMAA